MIRVYSTDLLAIQLGIRQKKIMQLLYSHINEKNIINGRIHFFTIPFFSLSAASFHPLPVTKRGKLTAKMVNLFREPLQTGGRCDTRVLFWAKRRTVSQPQIVVEIVGNLPDEFFSSTNKWKLINSRNLKNFSTVIRSHIQQS